MYVEKKSTDKSINQRQSSEIGNTEEETMTRIRDRALCVAMFESLPTNSCDYAPLLSWSIDI